MGRKKSEQFEVTTYEMARDFYDALLLRNPVERLHYILSLYPELWYCTQENLAGLLGLARETVCLTLKKLRRITQA